jgi:hypothetical protein
MSGNRSGHYLLVAHLDFVPPPPAQGRCGRNRGSKGFTGVRFPLAHGKQVFLGDRMTNRYNTPDAPDTWWTAIAS